MPIVGTVTSRRIRKAYYVKWDENDEKVSIYSTRYRSWFGCACGVKFEKDALIMAQHFIDTEPPELLP